MNARSPLALSLCSVVLVSCGGGGGGGGTPPPPLNEAPTITVPAGLGGLIPSYSFALPTGTSQSLQFAASDPDGDPLKWEIALDSTAAAAGVGYSSPLLGDTFVLTFATIAVPVASTVRLLVEDARGGAAAIDLLVVRSGAPTIASVTPDSAFAGKPQTVEVIGGAFQLGGTVITNVLFDGLLANNVQVQSDGRLTCRTPISGAPGPTIVSVNHTYGTAALPAAAFTLFAYPPAFAPLDQRLDASVAASHAIAVSGAFVHAVWLETGVVHHRRSLDGGTTWLPAVAISGAESASEPQVVVEGGEVLVAWIGNGQEVRLRRSTDAGLTFAPSFRLDAGTTQVNRVRLCLGGTRAHAAWVAGDAVAGTARIVAAGSNDRGETWNLALPVDNGPANQGEHAIATNGTATFLVCLDERAGPNTRGVYVTRSAGGVGFAPLQRVSQTGVVSSEPCLAVLGNRVHTAWVHAGSLFYAGSNDGGTTWPSGPSEIRNAADAAGGTEFGPVTGPQIRCTAENIFVAYGMAGNMAWVSRFPSAGAIVGHVRVDGDADPDAQFQLGASGAYVYAAWREGAVGDGSARVRQCVSTDSGATFTVAAGLGDGTAAQDEPRLAFSGARLVLGWLDSRDAAVGLRVNRSTQ